MTSSKNEVCVFVRQIENTLQNPKDDSDVNNIFLDIESLIRLDNETELKTINFSNYREARTCFVCDFYLAVLKCILRNISSDTCVTKRVSGDRLNSFLQFVFTNGNHKDSLISLTWGICEFRPSYRLNKCVSLLEYFLQSHLLYPIIKQQCSITNPVEQTYIWDELINTIASLPDRTASKLQSQNSEIFYPKSYIPLVTADIITVLHGVRSSVESSTDVSLDFISRLIAKLCITGYSDIMMDVLVGYLAPLVREDYIWCRMSERFLTGVPDRCLECVLLSLIDKLPWYGLMDKFLGDSVLKKQKIQYLLCTKVLLFRHSEKIHILQNVLGYLGTSHTRRHLLIKSFKELLGVWGDSSAIRHTSPEQHLYLTRALFICMGFLTEKDKETHKDELIRLIMPGVQSHIGNSEQKIRIQGMVLAETLASVVDPNGPKLKFEYKKDKDTEALLELMIPPTDPGIEQLQKKLKDIEIQQPTDIKQEVMEEETKEGVVSDLDSDDDLVPYDMSNDVKVTKVKKPKYIRDCMEGLICNDEPDRTEICLQCADSLIRKQPDGLEEIAAEFTKVLLHLSDKYASSGFTQQRFQAMVALAVSVPVPVSDYITGEFYDRNYNLRQRMDMLELAIKREEKEFLLEFEDLKHQFRDILITAGVNQSQFPVTPNRNEDQVDPLTPTFMNTPRGLTDLDIHKCLLINTLNDSALHDDGLGSDRSSDVEHSPMSTDTELSDYEDDTVFLEREVEGCENNDFDNLEDSVHFSASFVTGHVSNNTEHRKKTSGSSKGQGSNPLASSTMIEEEHVPVWRKNNTAYKGSSNPKASSTLLYKPFPERKVNKSFAPVVKVKDLQVIPTCLPEKKKVCVNNDTNDANSVFTWSLQHTSSDVPLEESYLRSVKKRSTKPLHASRQMSTVNSRLHSTVSNPNFSTNKTLNGLSIIGGKSSKDMIINDSLCQDNTLYNKTRTIPRSSTRSDLQNNRQVIQRQTEEGTFKKPLTSSKDIQAAVTRKNSVVKKLLRFRDSFKRKNGTTDLHTLATL